MTTRTYWHQLAALLAGRAERDAADLRDQRGMTRAELAAAFGVSEARIDATVEAMIAVGRVTEEKIDGVKAVRVGSVKQYREKQRKRHYYGGEKKQPGRHHAKAAS